MPDWPADRVERRAVATLVPYARNARTHNEAQIRQIAEAIEQWGWTNPILIAEDGVIIAGHGRIMAAEKLGIADVPVMIARGWTENQKRAYAIADNKLALNAGWDEHLLTAELFDIGDELRSFVGFSMDELRGLSIGVGEAEFPDIPDGERSDFRSISFALHKDQLPIIEAALAAAKAMGEFATANPNSNGNALERICGKFLEWQPPKTSALRQ